MFFMKNTTIYVKGMHCRSCEVLLEDALSQNTDITQVSVNHTTGRVVLQHTKILSMPQVHKCIIKNGYSIGQELKPWITKDALVWSDFALAALTVTVL
jgi:copper chaperone CopZ